MTQNNINNNSNGLIVGDLDIGSNTLSCITGDFIINGNSGNSIVMKNGATTLLTINSSGLQTINNNPGFLVARTANESDITGDGTAAVPTWTTERYDTAGNFSAPNFVAPVTGKYYFSLGITFAGIIAGMTTGYVKLITSNRTYTKYWNPFGSYGTSVNILGSTQLYAIADMDVSDTASVEVSVSGGTKTADLRCFATVLSCYFNGVLIS